MHLVHDRSNRTEAGFTPNEFEYNALGQRIRITDSTGTTYFVWDGIRITHEHDGAGNVTKRYTYGQSPIEGASDLIDLQDLEAGGDPHYFYHFDQVGGIHRLTAEDESTAQTLEFSPFGRMLTETGSAPNPFAFPATYRRMGDVANVGLSPTRTYDAALGRFQARDPLRQVPMVSLYVYAMGCPTTGLDPAGLQVKATFTWQKPSYTPKGFPTYIQLVKYLQKRKWHTKGTEPHGAIVPQPGATGKVQFSKMHVQKDYTPKGGGDPFDLCIMKCRMETVTVTMHTHVFYTMDTARIDTAWGTTEVLGAREKLAHEMRHVKSNEQLYGSKAFRTDFEKCAGALEIQVAWDKAEGGKERGKEECGRVLSRYLIDNCFKSAWQKARGAAIKNLRGTRAKRRQEDYLKEEHFLPYDFGKPEAVPQKHKPTAPLPYV
jgi:RHS repeat-associated protein